jgi:hypothetical protein
MMRLHFNQVNETKFLIQQVNEKRAPRLASLLAIHCAQKDIHLENDDLENEILAEKCQPTLPETPAHLSWVAQGAE